MTDPENEQKRQSADRERRKPNSTEKWISGESKWMPGRPVEEGVPAGSRVRLPAAARPPLRIFINGVQQFEGKDFLIRDNEILFMRPIIKEGKVSRSRWIAMYMGLFGNYQKNEIIDIEYRDGENIKLITDAPLVDDVRPNRIKRGFGGPGIS